MCETGAYPFEGAVDNLSDTTRLKGVLCGFKSDRLLPEGCFRTHPDENDLGTGCPEHVRVICFHV